MEAELETQTPPSNTGVIWRDPQPGDYMAGGESGITFEEIVPDGHWRPYNPVPGSLQGGVYFDGSTCTNHACTHSVYMQIVKLLADGKVPQEGIDKLTRAGYIVDGKFQVLSPRYNALKSGTVYGVGNYLYKPWDSARHDGLVPEAACPFPRTQRTPVYTEKDYFNQAVITPELDALAKILLEVFEIRYEVVLPTTEQMLQHKKQAPLAIITGCCRPWADGIIPACELSSGHATVFDDHETNVWKGDFDSYIPQQKKLAWDYIISYAIKGVVLVKATLPKPVLPVTPPKYSFSRVLQFGSRGEEVAYLQDFLKHQGLFPLNVPSTAYYGLVTKKAVLAFQLKYNLDNPVNLKAWGGNYWGARSIAKANELSK